MNNMKADKESVYRPEMMRKARKCIYKILKNFRVEKSGEISRNLRFSCALALFSCLHLNQTRIMTWDSNKTVLYELNCIINKENSN